VLAKSFVDVVPYQVYQAAFLGKLEATYSNGTSPYVIQDVNAMDSCSNQIEPTFIMELKGKTPVN
jgi:hypothetical protein